MNKTSAIAAEVFANAVEATTESFLSAVVLAEIDLRFLDIFSNVNNLWINDDLSRRDNGNGSFEESKGELSRDREFIEGIDTATREAAGIGAFDAFIFWKFKEVANAYDFTFLQAVYDSQGERRKEAFMVNHGKSNDKTFLSGNVVREYSFGLDFS
jgi:hypothetical protein